MNVLHISSAKTWRGGERQVQFLIKGQANHENKVSLMCPVRSPLKDKCNHYIKEHIPFKNGAIGYPINLMALLKFCGEQKIDIIHGHDSHAHTLIWMAYKIGRLKAKSLVTKRLNNPIKDKSKTKYNYPKVRKIICVSKAVKEMIEPKILDPNRLSIIHSAIDLNVTSNPKSIALNQKNVVGYVAAFTEEKNHQLFIEVALNLLKKNDQYRFLLVGDGPLLERTKALVNDYSDKFKFTGFVDNVNAEYAKMDLLLHTARSEALGTSILDGMKFGLPIVANDVGGIKELVKHNINGLLVRDRNVIQLSDYVDDILSNPLMYEEMSSQSIALTRPFGVSTMVEKTMILYREILDL